MKINPRLRPTHGFTLLELVVVVAVLVILAGFILPKFDVFKLKANKGVAAANMSGISRVIQQYYVQNSIYPDGWDSLLTGEATPALWRPDATPGAPGIDPQLVGPAPNPTKLKLGTALSDGDARSLTRIGIATVYTTSATPPTSGAPNDAFETSKPIAAGVQLAELNEADPEGDGLNIINHIYPDGNGVPTGKRLVVLGLGNRNSMLGQLIQEIPFYPNTDLTRYYSRYLAVFQVSDSGSRAELKAIIGSDGDLIKEEIADYYER